MYKCVCIFSGAPFSQWKLEQQDKYPPGSWAARDWKQIADAKKQTYFSAVMDLVCFSCLMYEQDRNSLLQDFPGIPSHSTLFWALYPLQMRSTRMKILLGNRQEKWQSKMLSLTPACAQCRWWLPRRHGSCHPQDPHTRKGERAHQWHLLSLRN